ncbi:MAG: SMI1/KNR4 family protein [Rhodospirillaceae bacterium]|nr:SMI1/KNR4 family protein [Rhodospirillaceae bacterium]MYB13639.1 SMI1/KNR4 family protein [Rhodospirillaceae bacterium]
MKRSMLMNSERTEGVRKVSAPEIEEWGRARGVFFPLDFVEFLSEFGGIYPDEEWGYQFIPEGENYPEFADMAYFLHFDKRVGRHSVGEAYESHFLSWNQPLLIPFSASEINVYAALNFEESRRNPSVYNVEVFVQSKIDPDRSSMTWLADSFTEFLEILETEDDFDARHGEVYRF